jgi:hypothetical protein
MTAIDPVTLPSWCTAPPSALRKRHPAELENAKAQFLGKAGRVTELMKGLGQLGIDEKKTAAPPSTRPSRPSRPR